MSIVSRYPFRRSKRPQATGGWPGSDTRELQTLRTPAAVDPLAAAALDLGLDVLVGDRISEDDSVRRDLELADRRVVDACA